MRSRHLSLLARFSSMSPSYVPGSNAAITLWPSGPSHTPTLNGMPTTEPHVSFCVENPLMPQCASTLGTAAVNPKQSGSMYSLLATPSSRRNQRLPYITFRMSDSADGVFVSFSSTDEPQGNQRPAAT